MMKSAKISLLSIAIACAKSQEPCGDERCADDDVTDYYATSSHYDKLFGNGNMGFGYYPHLERSGLSGHSGAGSTSIVLDFSQASTKLTERIMSIASIQPGDRVLDLGSGKGLACMEIARATGAQCTGVDFTPENVEKANAVSKERYPELNVRFFVGSFTDLPAEVLADGPYDIIVSRVALCHAHSNIHEFFEQVKKALKPRTGRAIINDFLGGDGPPSETTLENVYQRMHFTELKGPIQWRQAADEAGLSLVYYEDISEHLAFGYSQLETVARKFNIKSANGDTLLGDQYRESVNAVQKQEIVMNLAHYRLL